MLNVCVIVHDGSVFFCFCFCFFNNPFEGKKSLTRAEQDITLGTDSFTSPQKGVVKNTFSFWGRPEPSSESELE